jgi:hypothetical protein
MNATIELILADGTREPAVAVFYSDRDQLLLRVREALKAARSRPDVVAARAWYEDGGQVRVDRLRGSAVA